MKRDSENREWLDEYMSLKQVNPENPFTVPEGYFDSLDGQIISRIKLGEMTGAMPGSGFTVPENYFDELAGNITSRINIEEAADKETAGFTVPDGYFDELSANITSRINVEEASDKEARSFAVPDGYFDELSDKITARINVEEAADKEAHGFTIPGGYFENLGAQIQSRIFVEETLSEQQESFSVPNNYFDKLSENILAKTVDHKAGEEKGKSRGVIVRTLVRSAAFKYATAACLVLAVGGTLFLNISTNPDDSHKNSFLHKSLAALPLDDIQNYLEVNSDANDTKTLIEETKQADADNLSKDLQQALDSTSQ